MPLCIVNRPEDSGNAAMHGLCQEKIAEVDVLVMLGVLRIIKERQEALTRFSPSNCAA